MTMTPTVAGLQITRDLHAFEARLAETLAAGARLTATMTNARAECQASPILGHKALLLTARIQTALLTANGDTARVHESLRGVAREMGIVIEDTPTSGVLAVPNQPAAAELTLAA